MVTAETAVVLPALVLVLVLALGAIAHGITALRAADAARAGARAAARGETTEVVEATARREVPSASSIRVRPEGAQVVVDVVVPGTPVLLGSLWPGVRWPDVHASAVAWQEQP